MDSSGSGFVFLGANTPWVYALAAALACRGAAVSAIASYDAKNFRRLNPRWPDGEVPSGLRRRFWVLPRGYVGVFAPVFAPFLRWRLARAMVEVSEHGSPWVVVPYPWFHRIVRGVPAGRLIYYNLDDYPLYQPERTSLIQQQENELLDRSALTICLSQQQVETLRTRVPADRAARISHFPLGVSASYLNPHPERAPTPRTVGYVGNLIDRVDWRLVGETARAMPDVEFIFVGGLEGSGGGGSRHAWESERAAALTLPNVRRVGPVRQEDVPTYYWGFSVNWIPYATDHAFNQAACPTKIMDGLASGRPVVGTDLPELRLYPDWITVARDASEMVAALSQWLAAGSGSAEIVRATGQVAYARNHTWTCRAETLAAWLYGES